MGTKTDLVLDLNPLVPGEGLIDREVVVPLLQREEPNDGADDEDNEGVQDQKPVENDKTGCDMVLLHDCEYGHEECDEKEDSGDETA